jgi:hypothetical protein
MVIKKGEEMISSTMLSPSDQKRLNSLLSNEDRMIGSRMQTPSDRKEWERRMIVKYCFKEEKK